MHREANYQWLRSFDFFFSYKKSSRVVVFECRVYWLFGWHVLIILLLLFRFALFINFGLYAVCIRARVKLRRFNSHLAENSFELTVDWSCVCYYCSFDDIYLFFFFNSKYVYDRNAVDTAAIIQTHTWMFSMYACILNTFTPSWYRHYYYMSKTLRTQINKQSRYISNNTELSVDRGDQKNVFRK